MKPHRVQFYELHTYSIINIRMGIRCKASAYKLLHFAKLFSVYNMEDKIFSIPSIQTAKTWPRSWPLTANISLTRSDAVACLAIVTDTRQITCTSIQHMGLFCVPQECGPRGGRRIRLHYEQYEAKKILYCTTSCNKDWRCSSTQWNLAIHSPVASIPETTGQETVCLENYALMRRSLTRRESGHTCWLQRLLLLSELSYIGLRRVQVIFRSLSQL